MGTRDITHEALAKALSEGAALTDEQRSVLLGAVADDKAWQHEVDRLRAENERLRAAMGVAYGYLWCVNNEPGTPHQYPPEKAAYQARKTLRHFLTSSERGHFINAVLPLVRAKDLADDDPLPQIEDEPNAIVSGAPADAEE